MGRKGEGERGRGGEGQRGRGAEGNRGKGAEGQRGTGGEGKKGRVGQGERETGEQGDKGRGAEGQRGTGGEGQRGTELLRSGKRFCPASLRWPITLWYVTLNTAVKHLCTCVSVVVTRAWLGGMLLGYQNQVVL